MSADGEIEIAVKAEGAQDAAAEVADSDAAPAGGGGGQPGGFGRGLARAGTIGFIVSKLLGPILDILGPIQQLLEAFLAPIAILLLRLLQPALRLLIKVLPAWLNFIDTIIGLVEFVQETSRDIWSAITRWVPRLPGLIRDKLQSAFDTVVSTLESLPSDIWQKVKQLAGMIATKIGEQLPDFGGTVSNATSAFGSAVDDAQGVFNNPGQTAENVQITLAGGLDTLVERIERDTNFEF